MATAKDIFDAAFDSPRNLRSPQYKEGVLSALKNAENAGNIHHPYIYCPYAAGTPEFDAWFSGRDEGRRLWQVNKDAGLI